MTEQDLVNILIVKLRLTPVHARLTARILLRGVASYEELAEVAGGKNHSTNSVKVQAWRMNRMRAFEKLGIEALNAFAVGYYFDSQTRRIIFKELGCDDPITAIALPDEDADTNGGSTEQIRGGLHGE